MKFTEDNDNITEIDGNKAYPLFIISDRNSHTDTNYVFHGIYYWCNNHVYILDNFLVLYKHEPPLTFIDIVEFSDSHERFFEYNDISNKYNIEFCYFRSRTELLSYIDNIILNKILETV